MANDNSGVGLIAEKSQVFIPFAAACGPQEDSHINAAADAPAHAAVRRRLVAILKAAALKST